ncbi:MAG TPA: ThuA domain-containing protein [Bryobacteraceae bacterium]|nr:ThuA domain-containing protein [Bryobacteraceae bacterium]
MKPSTVCTLLLGAISFAPAQAPHNKIQALIITGQNGHDWRATTPVLRKLLEDTGRFEVRVTEEYRGAGQETLAPYDVVILNYYDKKQPDLRWGERADTALLSYVRGGKGLVVYHFAVAAFDGWDEYEKMCGGNWRPNNGHHSARHDFTVEIKDKEHPVTRGMKASFAQSNDELYANLKWQPIGAYHVLATAWDDHSRYGPAEKQPIPGSGLDQPMLWTVNYGKGRVFVTALGHDAEAMKTAGFVATLTRGTEWAATGDVSIPLPDELR